MRQKLSSEEIMKFFRKPMKRLRPKFTGYSPIELIGNLGMNERAKTVHAGNSAHRGISIIDVTVLTVVLS